MTLAGASILEAEYKPDMEVLDRYQAYSAEVARLAALALVAFGFLLQIAFHEGHRTEFGSALLSHPNLLGLGVVLLGFAIGFALAHRYVSTDVLASLIRSIRLGQMAREASKPESDARVAEAQQLDEQQELRQRLAQSAWAIAVASFCLVAGALCLSLTALVAFAT